MRGDRDLLLGGIVKNGVVSLPNQQGSHMLKSLTESDVVVHISASAGSLEKGATIKMCYIHKS